MCFAHDLKTIKDTCTNSKTFMEFKDRYELWVYL